MINYCNRCDGMGEIKELDAKWWQFWKLMKCPECGGDGYANPPAPPIKKFYCTLCKNELKIWRSSISGKCGKCGKCGKWHILT